MQIMDQDSPSGSDPSSDKGWWNLLWKLKIPNKLKIFGWKAGQEILPTLNGLWKRNISQDPFCPRCKKKEESVMHALFFCKFAKEVWKLSSCRRVLKISGASDFGNCIVQIGAAGLESDLEVITTTAWAVWYARNQVVHRGSPIPLSVTLEHAGRMLEAFHEHHPASPLLPKKSPEPWVPPPSNELKINVDATVTKAGWFGSGFIIRDQMGFPIKAGQRWQQCSFSILEAEAKCLLWGLQQVFASNSFTSFDILVESDNKILVDLLNGKTKSILSVSLIVDDVLSLIHEELGKTGRKVVSISHIPRGSNEVAHVLATSFDYSHNIIWEYDFSDIVLDLCLKDICPRY